MLIVGSVALNKICKDRLTNDLDILCYRNEIPYLEVLFNTTHRKDKNEFKTFLRDSSGRQIECMIIDKLKGFQELAKCNELQLNYANATALFLLKKSHINRPVKFEKHIKDYHLLKNMLPCLGGVAQEVETTLELLLKDQETIHGELKTPSLNKSKSSFFKDKVIKIFEHDDIHSIMAHKEQPMYTYMQKPNSEVICSKKLWDNFTHSDKIKTVLEEAYVIALERKILPHIFLGHKYWSNIDAFKWALMRICTTLCKGWFREFAVDNYFEILDAHNTNYVYLFISEFENGKIKPLN